jgi:hypothetical protein
MGKVQVYIVLYIVAAAAKPVHKECWWGRLSKTENSGHYCVKAAYIDESNALPLPKKEKKKIPNDARTYHARTTSSTTPTSMRRDHHFCIPRRLRPWQRITPSIQNINTTRSSFLPSKFKKRNKRLIEYKSVSKLREMLVCCCVFTFNMSSAALLKRHLG